MRKADWLIGALIAFLVLFGISFFVKNYKNIQNQQPDRPSVNETLRQAENGETATLDEEDAYDEEEYSEDIDTSAYEPNEPTIEDLTNLNATRGETEDENTGNSTNNRPTAYGSDADGSFLVVAGTFKQEINAQAQLKKFRRMGYDNAEIGKFNKSTYASLIVDRFATSTEANTLVKELKNKGLEAYVHRKR